MCCPGRGVGVRWSQGPAGVARKGVYRRLEPRLVDAQEWRAPLPNQPHRCGSLPWGFKPPEPGHEGSRVKRRLTSLHVQNVLPVLSPASCSLSLWKWGLQVNV